VITLTIRQHIIIQYEKHALHVFYAIIWGNNVTSSFIITPLMSDDRKNALADALIPFYNDNVVYIINFEQKKCK